MDKWLIILVAILFPAWAGVILHLPNSLSGCSTFPRMGGGDPKGGKMKLDKLDFSPHGRG